jgi:hypothetical protein
MFEGPVIDALLYARIVLLYASFFHRRSLALADIVEITFDTKSWNVFIVVFATHNANARLLNTCGTGMLGLL